MRSVYEDARIPLQIRRLMIFNDICRKAKQYPDEVVYLTPESQLALGVMYLQNSKKYIAFGGVFEYAHTRKDVIEQGVHHLPHDEYVMCAITVKPQAFTKPVRTSFELLWHWNNYIKNRRYTYVGTDIHCFFPVNDELEMDYPPYKFHDRLVATARLPLWEDRDELISDVYRDNEGRLRPKGYPEKCLV
ncbi:hypothetical protein H4W00_000322 [Psychrobacter sp. PL19]|uniref:hypothetical protein n=1 Tax=Psychrobacter sp. PL19 TaxID=2760711 RepID=UPI001AE5A1FF